MSVLGVDIGSSYCVLATIVANSVQIVRNELSERLTPALVAYTEKERLVGEAAQTQLGSNYKNTARYLKQLLGMSRLNEAEVKEETQYSLCPLDFTDEREGAMAGYCVKYKNKEFIFSATRCLATLLAHLREVGEKSTGMGIKDVVISVPPWFSESARQAVLDAADIAGLHCLQTLSDHVAIALDYGVYRAREGVRNASEPLRVAFVSMGHASTTVAVVDYTDNQLQVKAVATDKHLGGRDFDRAIVQHFAKQCQTSFGMDPLKNVKSLLKLESAASKAKKVLSANAEAPFHVECVVEDQDLSSLLNRQQFEDLCAPYQEQLRVLLARVFDETDKNGIKIDTIRRVEVVGGCTRIPWIQDVVAQHFKGLTISKTLNLDESVARGCALMAASRRNRLAKYRVVDRVLSDVSVSYAGFPGPLGSPPSDDQNVRPKTGHWQVMNSGSELHLNKPESSNNAPSPLEWKYHFGAKYSRLVLKLGFGSAENPDPAQNPCCVIVEPPAVPLDQVVPAAINVYMQMTSNQILSVNRAALMAEKIPTQETTEVKNDQQQPMADDASAPKATAPAAGAAAPAEEKPSEPAASQQSGADQVKSEKKKEKKLQRLECSLKVQPRSGFLSEEARQMLRDEEAKMAADDRVQQETKEALNSLEAYIYNMRDKLQGSFAPFATQEESTSLLKSLKEAEDWVYDFFEEGTKEMYCKKLYDLKVSCYSSSAVTDSYLQAKGDVLTERYEESERRAEAQEQLEKTIMVMRGACGHADWAHVESSKKQSLIQKLDETQQWLNSVVKQWEAGPKAQTPLPGVKAKEVVSQKEMLENFAKTIKQAADKVVAEATAVAEAAAAAAAAAASPKNEEEVGAKTEKDTTASAEATQEEDVKMD